MKTRKLIIAIIVLIFGGINIFAQTDAEKEGQEIFEKYQAALGGKESLAKIKTVESETETTTGIGTLIAKYIEDKVNNRNYLRSVSPDGTVTEMGFDGKRSWMKRNGDGSYANITQPSPIVKRIKKPNEKIDGKEYLVVEEVRESSRENSKAYYDAETFLLYQTVKTVGFNGETMELKSVYSDYRKVGDILEPFLLTSTNPRSGTSIRKTISIKHNVEVSQTIFEF